MEYIYLYFDIACFIVAIKFISLLIEDKIKDI